MKEILSWTRVAGLFLRYTAYRRGLLAERPTVDDMPDAAMVVVGRVLGWSKYLHVRGGENCPTDHPCIFCGNHHKLDDPFALFRAAFLGSKGQLILRAMMRDDFFANIGILKNWLFDIDDFMPCLGVYLINRDKVSIGQIRPFLKSLEEGRGFILFPGRTRSRSGMLMEYRDNFQEPGGASFFLAQTQRRFPERKVGAMPAARTFNPVTKRTVVIFGAPMYLDPEAKREQQRSFDASLVEAIGGLVEVNMMHVLSLVLMFRCLHNNVDAMEEAELRDAAFRVFDIMAHEYTDPEVEENFPKAFAQTRAHLVQVGALLREGARFRPAAEAILRVPPFDKKFCKRNPVRYYSNQVLHLADVTKAAEKAALGFEQSDMSK